MQDRLDPPDAQAEWLLSGGAQFASEFKVQFEKPVGVVQEAGAGGRQAKALMAPVQEECAKLLLECRDAVRDRRLAEAEFLCRAGDAVQARDPYKGLDEA